MPYASRRRARFFFGAGRQSARIIGLRGSWRKRSIHSACSGPAPGAGGEKRDASTPGGITIARRGWKFSYAPHCLSSSSCVRHDDEGRLLERVLLGGDAPPEVELPLDRLLPAARLEEPALLDAPERVARVHERNSEDARELRADVSGVRVMAVQDVGEADGLSEERQAAVDEVVEVPPEVLLADVAARPERDAQDPRALPSSSTGRA